MDAIKPSPIDPHAWEVAPRLRRGLGLLAEGWHYARAAEVTVWDFAVELARLRRLQLTNNDLRFLVLQGVVEHALELTVAGDSARSFRLNSGLVFARRTCFVLSTAGAAVTGDLAFASERSNTFLAPPTASLEGVPPGGAPLGSVLPSGDRSSVVMDSLAQVPAPGASRHVAVPADRSPSAARLTSFQSLPRWDTHRLELRVGKIVLKRFTLPAPHVESVLAAFEEQGWPARIDNPLHGKTLNGRGDQDAGERLQQAVDALNRQQRRPLVRFFLDEQSSGVCWQAVDDSAC